MAITPKEKHAHIRRKLLESGYSIAAFGRRHGMSEKHIYVALDRYLAGTTKTPNSPRVYRAIKELETITGIKILTHTR